MNTDLLATALIVILIGVTALVLVGGELGRRAGLPLAGRVALMCGLGFGVIAFTIKGGLIFYLNGLQRGDVAAAREIVAESARPRVTRPAVIQSRTVSDARSWAVWRRLPATPPIPANNPQTREKIALGEMLFNDTTLSRDRTVSCASCHKLGEGGDDNASVSSGVDGQKGDRNAPTVLNAAFLSRLFWDGRAKSLEDQAKQPLVNPVEMAMPSHAAVVARLRESRTYVDLFEKAFGGSQPITIDTVARAIAAFERTLITPQSAYDRFVAGDESALSPQAKRGMALFGATGCRNCHVDPMFSSAGTLNGSGPYRAFPVYPDKALVRKYGLDDGGAPKVWRVPSLRNVANTAPYFHNGSVTTLEEAIRVMAVAQLDKVLSDDPNDDIRILSSPVVGSRRERFVSFVENRALDEREISDIAAFLRSLSSPLPGGWRELSGAPAGIAKPFENARVKTLTLP